MKTLLWIFTIIGALIGGLFMVVGLFISQGAPQEAAAAAMGVGFAVIPFCLAYAVSKLSEK